MFALHGLSLLVEWYVGEAQRRQELRTLPPEEYLDDSRPNHTGWFADEVGRAIVPSLEIGIQAQRLLRRDAQRMLDRLAWCILLTSGLAATGSPPDKPLRADRSAFPEETGFLLASLEDAEQILSEAGSDWSAPFERVQKLRGTLIADFSSAKVAVEAPSAGRRSITYGRAEDYRRFTTLCLLNGREHASEQQDSDDG